MWHNDIGQADAIRDIEGIIGMNLLGEGRARILPSVETSIFS